MPRVPVLVVDDRPANLAALEAVLGSADYELVRAQTGREAIQALLARQFAVALLDVVLPDADGIEVALEIQRRTAYLKTPIIFLTAYDATPERVLAAYSAGAVDFVHKPFEPAVLRAKVAVFAELYRARSEVAAEKRAGAALEKRTAVLLHQSEQRFHQLVDAVTDYAIFMLDPTGHVVTWNPGVRRIKGYEPDEIIGQHFSIFYPPEDRASGRPERVLETARREGRFEEEAWRVRKDGSRFWANVLITPLHDPNGGLTGFVKVTRDLTDRRAAEENERRLEREQIARVASEAARAEMDRVNRLKDEFLSTMSHELRTPLNAISGWATLLQRKPRDPDKLDKGLEVIDRNAKMQARLINDLLDLSRIISGKLQLAATRAEMLPIIVAAADVVRPAATNKGVRLVVDVDPEIGATTADPDRLQQILWNLLTNAVKFTPKGGRVTVTAERERSSMVLSVQDTGVGIAPELLPHVFERFMQGDASTTRAHGGLGLGLAIVRHLVEAHGGTVEAQSEGVGRGATFTVRLPIRPVSVRPVEAPAEIDTDAADAESEITGSFGSLDGVRILAVDDDPDSLEVVREVLERAGAQVTTAHSAREGFDAIDARGPFDVIVSDIGMPETDGYGFIRSVRARVDGANVPAIALTAYARPTDAERARHAGFQEHLAKPIDERRLLRTVKAVAAKLQSGSPYG